MPLSTLAKDPEQIRKMFDSIADRYDRLNLLLSLGMHPLWQQFAVRQINLQPGQAVLDVCCGTGRITRSLAEKVGATGRVTGIDLSGRMLQKARLYLYPRFSGNVRLIQGDAQKLPFDDATFHSAIVGYGIRNVPDPGRLLSEMQRVVQPGGRVVSLEMTRPELPILNLLYRLYLSHLVPGWGRLIAHNRSAYEYLHRSILEFSPMDEITELMIQLGLKEVKCYPLCWGAVAIHVGVVASSV